MGPENDQQKKRETKEHFKFFNECKVSKKFIFPMSRMILLFAFRGERSINQSMTRGHLL